LSGGNQQKVVFGKWLSAEPSVLLLDEPTRGIDVNAKAEVYALIDHLAASGCGIVLVASELQELIGLADRILVLGEGRLVAEFRTPDLDQEQLMAAMALARTGSVTHV
jgi:L-arabinose transport system ATP-binding protein